MKQGITGAFAGSAFKLNFNLHKENYKDVLRDIIENLSQRVKSSPSLWLGFFDERLGGYDGYCFLYSWHFA